jgi:hypothetical protein
LIRGDIIRSTFKYKCHCGTTIFVPETQDFTTGATTNVIGNKRQHNKKYYDDVMRITLHNTVASNKCEYKG